MFKRLSKVGLDVLRWFCQRFLDEGFFNFPNLGYLPKEWSEQSTIHAWDWKVRIWQMSTPFERCWTWPGGHQTRQHKWPWALPWGHFAVRLSYWSGLRCFWTRLWVCRWYLRDFCGLVFTCWVRRLVCGSPLVVFGFQLLSLWTGFRHFWVGRFGCSDWSLITAITGFRMTGSIALISVRC